jgi:hypothetical protein
MKAFELHLRPSKRCEGVRDGLSYDVNLCARCAGGVPSGVKAYKMAQMSCVGH